MAKSFCLAVLSLALVFSCACKKSGAGSASSVQSEAMQAAQLLPDGTNVLAAIDRKEWETAVSTLGKMQPSLTPELESPFMTLKQHVRGVLIDASTTDPKAQEALTALRMMTQGR
jgi:hypothetical protein